MAEANDPSSKTEEPTQKRLDDSHAKGQFAKAQEIQIAFILGAILLTLLLTADNTTKQVSSMMVFFFTSFGKIQLSDNQVAAATGPSLTFLLSLVLPLASACTAAAIFAGGIQSSWKMTPKALKLNWQKLDPIKGFHEKFSKTAFVKFGFELLKFGGIAGVIYFGVWRVAHDPIFQSPISFEHTGIFIRETVVLLLIILILVIGAIGALHFMYQKWKTHQDMKMTHQELKDERKQQDGDPLLKAAQRQKAFQLSSGQMLRDVLKADLVLTNPTHFAVALRYQRSIDPAPVILAKGQDLIALKIREIAKAQQIPIVENPPLARMLYKLGKVGQPIPVELYKMTATVLAYVYRTYRYYFHQRSVQEGNLR